MRPLPPQPLPKLSIELGAAEAPRRRLASVEHRLEHRSLVRTVREGVANAPPVDAVVVRLSPDVLDKVRPDQTDELGELTAERGRKHGAEHAVRRDACAL